MSRFKQGQKVNAIFFDNDGEFRVGDSCLSITVVMENGQWAGVPWFEVRSDKPTTKWNGALLHGVELIKEPE